MSIKRKSVKSAKSAGLNVEKANADLAEILHQFVNGDAGRTVSVQALSGLAVECSINAEVLRPAASVIKLPMIMAIYKKAALGLIDLEKKVPVSTFSETRYVSVLAAFDQDTSFSIREICRLAIITSDNPLAVYLNTLVAFDEVNALLLELCADNRLLMRAGFSESELGPKNRENTLTGLACHKLLSEVWGNPLYRDVLFAMRNNLRGNRIPAEIPESVLVAHKTGSLSGVVNDIGLIEDGTFNFSVAFLTDNQSDPLRTTKDISESALAIYNYFKSIFS